MLNFRGIKILWDKSVYSPENNLIASASIYASILANICNP